MDRAVNWGLWYVVCISGFRAYGSWFRDDGICL